MKRYFKLKYNKEIIFTDWFSRNIKVNTLYEKWSDVSYKKDMFTNFNNPENFYKKNWKLIEHIQLSNVRYSWWQEIESTKTILESYDFSNIEEISEEEAYKILSERELDFSELYDKLNKLWKY